MTDDQSGNTSQKHGLHLENLLKTTEMFNGACNAYRPANAVIDIGRRHDRFLGLDTYVKAIKEGTAVHLANAPRFYDISIPSRFMVGEWIQINDELKRFLRIHEIILTPAILKVIRGKITYEEMCEYHDRIASTPRGRAGADLAREERKRIEKAIEGRHHPILTVNCKIGDEDERRVQLTISLQGLINLVREMTGDNPYRSSNGNEQLHYLVHTKRICQYPLPFDMLSSERRFGQGNIIQPDFEDHGPLFDLQPSNDQDQSAASGIDEELQQTLFRG